MKRIQLFISKTELQKFHFDTDKIHFQDYMFFYLSIISK